MAVRDAWKNLPSPSRVQPLVTISRALPAGAIALVFGALVGVGLSAAGQKAQTGWDADQRARDLTIANAPWRTEATLTSVEIDEDEHRNPNALHYTFAVEGTTYVGEDYSGEGGNPPYSGLAPGDRVHITYYTPDPQVSCACDPLADITNLNEIESSFGAAVGIAGGIAVAALTWVTQFLYSRYQVQKAKLTDCRPDSAITNHHTTARDARSSISKLSLADLGAQLESGLKVATRDVREGRWTSVEVRFVFRLAVPPSADIRGESRKFSALASVMAAPGLAGQLQFRSNTRLG